MARIESAFFDIGTLDRLAGRQNAVNRLDPRAKLIVTLVFTVTVVSFGKYEISALLPFLLFPAAMIAAADLPFAPLGRKLLLALPFVFFIGIFNPLFDTAPRLIVAGIPLSGGWVSFLSILLRCTLSVTAALILIATTSFTGVSLALERLGAPRAFALQLLFLYRYLYVLVDEGTRMVRARALRSFSGRGLGMTVYGHMLGQLLLRTLDRAGRVHTAMLCRGFDGEVRMLGTLRFGRTEWVFVLGWSALFFLFRFVNLPLLLGRFVERLAA